MFDNQFLKSGSEPFIKGEIDLPKMIGMLLKRRSLSMIILFTLIALAISGCTLKQSRNPPSESGVMDKIRDLREPVLVQVFSRKTCPYCPLAIDLVKRLSEESNGKIIYQVIDVDENPHLAARYNIRAVPTIVIDGKYVIVGVPSREELLSAILRARGLES